MVVVVVLAHLAGGAAVMHGGLGVLSGEGPGVLILGLVAILSVKLVLLAVIRRTWRRSLSSRTNSVPLREG